MECLQQTCARMGATIQSLRQQLGELEASKTASSQTNQVTRLQTELGRLKSELSSKNDQIEGQESQLSDKQADLDALQERAGLSDALVWHTNHSWTRIGHAICIPIQHEGPTDLVFFVNCS